MKKSMDFSLYGDCLRGDFVEIGGDFSIQFPNDVHRFFARRADKFGRSQANVRQGAVFVLFLLANEQNDFFTVSFVMNICLPSG